MAKIILATDKEVGRCAISKDYRGITRTEIGHLMVEIENIKIDLLHKWNKSKNDDDVAVYKKD